MALKYEARDIISRINQERFKKFAREHGLQISGLKDELIDRIDESIPSTIDIREFDSFLANEISHGKNRTLFISSFTLSAAENMKNIEYVKKALRENGHPTENFNNLRTTIQPEELTLSFLQISHNNDDLVHEIQLCYAKKIIAEDLYDSEGEELPPRPETDYIWVRIIPAKQRFIIKIRPRSRNHFDNEAKTKAVYEEVSTEVREMFSLVPRNMEDAKHTLFKIFKDLTIIAEKPFNERVKNNLSESITHFANECAEKLELPSAIDPINLPNRVFRLLERALIQQEFEEYRSYFEGKRGIIDRIAFSDQTGAFVNARSDQGDQGISVADIYFDTRETIDESQRLDKLWVTWFYLFEPGKYPQKIETKFECFKEHIILHFLYKYSIEEVEEHVLSNFEYYESLSD